jgi:hypothetical protein
MRVSVNASFILSRSSLGDTLSLGAGMSDVNRTMIRFVARVCVRMGDVCECCAATIGSVSASVRVRLVWLSCGAFVTAAA